MWLLLAIGETHLAAPTRPASPSPCVAMFVCSPAHLGQAHCSDGAGIQRTTGMLVPNCFAKKKEFISTLRNGTGNGQTDCLFSWLFLCTFTDGEQPQGDPSVFLCSPRPCAACTHRALRTVLRLRARSRRRKRRRRKRRKRRRLRAWPSAAAMDNSGKEREAVQLMAEAEKRVKGSHSFLRGLFGGNTRVEEACEMYTRAANMFKIAKNWSAAGNAFCQAAKLHMQLQSKHDSATSFVDAGNAYKKADPQGTGDQIRDCLVQIFLAA
uniref:NSF attachment protein beta n=1 Tax=Coturnix japonica TaxID=93934 RepID=A0A8C2U085_COTJA